MKSYIQSIGLVFMALILLYSCSKEDTMNTANLIISLTDAPGDFQEVNIEVIGVRAIIDDMLIELDAETGVYNLLELTNGKKTILVNQPVPAGMLSQVRLVLGENNTVMVDSELFDLKTPSAQQSGLKFNVHKMFSPEFTYEYLIDFDAARSVVITGNSAKANTQKYILKPVIRVFTEAVSGAIRGIVDPPETEPLIHAISSSSDTTSTYSDIITGEYVFKGMMEDIYKLEFIPDTSQYKDTILSDILVTTGIITVVDTVRITAIP